MKGWQNAFTYTTLLGSKCKSKENRRHKNSSSHSEKRSIGMKGNESMLSSNDANCKYPRSVKHLCTSLLRGVMDYVLTLENIEPINCMVARVLGGSLASIPSSALDNESIKSSIKSLSPSRSTAFTAEADRDVRNSERPTNATDITAIFN